MAADPDLPTIGESLTRRATEVAELQLARIRATDASVAAWAHLDDPHVRREAQRCELAATVAVPGALAGVGIGVKDIIATSEFPTENGSVIFAGNRPDADAASVARLKSAGGYVFGKTVTTPFAFIDPAKTRNPWNAAHTPGGSSSGSAAAVAMHHVAGAIGSQTNGSVIRPAAFCGVVGFKPTRAAIPCAGTLAFSPTFDTIGTFTRNVADAARLASALADSGRITATIAMPRAPLRIAMLATLPWIAIERDGADALSALAARLRAAGAFLVDVVVPAEWQDAHLVHRTIMFREGADLLGAIQARDGARMTPKLNAALDAGRRIPRAEYDDALRRRERAITLFADWLSNFDAVLGAPATGEAPASLATTGDPACCTLWSLLGFPAITIPVGLGAKGLPLGAQLAAPQGADDRLLAVAAWCERAVGFSPPARILDVPPP